LIWLLILYKWILSVVVSIIVIVIRLILSSTCLASATAERWGINITLGFIWIVLIRSLLVLMGKWMSRVSALVSWILSIAWIIAISRLLETVWSENYLVTTLIIIRWISTKSGLILRIGYERLLTIVYACVSKTYSLSLRWRFSVMTFNWTTYHTLCNLILLNSAISVFKILISAESVIMTLLWSIEILPSTSIIGHVQIFNTTGPLALSVSHWKLISLIRGRFRVFIMMICVLWVLLLMSCWAIIIKLSFMWIMRMWASLSEWPWVLWSRMLLLLLLVMRMMLLSWMFVLIVC